MSLDVTLTKMRPTAVFDANITHNLGPMAQEAGIYYYLWRPDEIGISKAEQLIYPLTYGLVMLKTNPVRFRQFDAQNGWGRYEDLVAFVEEYLAACKANPDADIIVSI